MLYFILVHRVKVNLNNKSKTISFKHHILGKEIWDWARLCLEVTDFLDYLYGFIFFVKFVEVLYSLTKISNVQENYQQKILGILGGGQLGRMLIQSAINYNIDIHILDPDGHAPCRSIAQKFTQGKLTDFDTVYNFGKNCDVITIEIENVNTAALTKLQQEGKKVFPQPHIIQMIQDKRQQKQFYLENGIPTAPFVLTDNKAAVMAQAGFLPAVNKLAREGYDGRGVLILRESADLDMAFDSPSLLEKLVDFDKEIAVIVARNENGELKCFPPVECSFHPKANLVEFLFSPAEISETICNKAVHEAKK